MLQHREHRGATGFGLHAMYQHRQPFARQQQRQQWREGGQAACAVVTGNDDGRHRAWRAKACHAGMHRIPQAAHLFGGFSLDAHGDAEGAYLIVADVAIQNLAKQVSRLCAVQRLGATCAAPDLFDVVLYGHGMQECLAYYFRFYRWKSNKKNHTSQCAGYGAWRPCPVQMLRRHAFVMPIMQGAVTIDEVLRCERLQSGGKGLISAV
ncbi:hypothetical protein D3C72_1533380 [compost metagenome]